MASSDEEGEIVPDCVDNYHFVDDADQPVSFDVLPLLWNDTDDAGSATKISLHGTANNGLQTLYKKVIAWKIDFSSLQPEISVLSKEKNWIKLQSPRKSSADTIRKILVTVHWLHTIKKNPEASKASIWKQLEDVLRCAFLRSYLILICLCFAFTLLLIFFSSYESFPSENDLLDHMELLSEAAKWDRDLARSEVCFISFPSLIYILTG